MILANFDNLKHFWESLRQLRSIPALFTRFSIAFRWLWHIQYGRRSLW